MDDFTAEQAFAAHFRALRERLGITQSDVAEIAVERGASLNQQAVAKLEAGKRKIRLDEAVTLAAIVQQPLVALLRPVLTKREIRAEMRRLREEIPALYVELDERQAAHADAVLALKRAERHEMAAQVRLDRHQRRLAELDEQLREEG